jgi:hypothetical protein
MEMNIPCDALSSLNDCSALTKMVANDVPYELLCVNIRGGFSYSDTGRSIYEDVDFPMILQEQDR